MLIVILILSTGLTVFWFLLLGAVTREDWSLAAYNKVYDNLTAIKKLRLKDSIKREKFSRGGGTPAFATYLLIRGGLNKKIEKLEGNNLKLRGGNLKSLSLLPMPGYVLLRKFEAIGRGGVHKSIMAKSYELYGKKHAVYIAKHLLAKLLSFPIIGVAMSFAVGALLIGLDKSAAGLAILAIGSVLILVLVYSMYDELSDRVKKRRAAISRQFPNVVSKLALLVTSGMIMDRAWKETAYSNSEELYLEMQKTSQELDNLVSPEAAFSSFIVRCSTKETAKLASAILQNQSKGNAEIGRLLKNMAREAWLERRHLAKRDAEKANSKLMIPTMLLLLAILIMLMVPIAMNFSSL